MKNLVFCLKHHAVFENCVKKSTFSGLGDIIRGLTFCYAIARGNGFNFFIDSSDHVLDSFLDTKDYKFQGNLPPEVPFIGGSKLINYINDNINKETLFVMTNGVPEQDEDPLPERFKKDLKKIFLSHCDIQEFIKKRNFKYSFHARFGDDSHVSNSFLKDFYISDGSHNYHPNQWFKLQPSSLKYQKTADFFQDIWSQVDFICSDHYEFCDFIQNFSKIPHYNQGSHLGIKDSYSRVFNTLCDFYTLSKSKKIISLASFPYGVRRSAFPLWASKLGESLVDYYHIDYSNLNIYKF